MEVIVKTNFRERYWNIGDRVELFGTELDKYLDSGDVELVDGLRCSECGKTAKSKLGLLSHERTHRKDGE